MAVVINSNFEGALEFLHPVSHQVDVLNHDPVTSSSCFLECLKGLLLLALTHRNVVESVINRQLLVLSTDVFDWLSGIHTREEHEERRNLVAHLIVHLLHVERRLLNVALTKTLQNVFFQGIRESIGTDRSQQQQLVEVGGVFL